MVSIIIGVIIDVLMFILRLTVPGMPFLTFVIMSSIGIALIIAGILMKLDVMGPVGSLLLCLLVGTPIISTPGDYFNFVHFTTYKPDTSTGYYKCTLDYLGFDVKHEAVASNGSVKNEVYLTFKMSPFKNCSEFDDVVLDGTININKKDYDFSLLYNGAQDYEQTLTINIDPTYTVNIGNVSYTNVKGTYYFIGNNENSFNKRMGLTDQYKIKKPNFTVRVEEGKIHFVNFKSKVAYLDSPVFDTNYGSVFGYSDLLCTYRYSVGFEILSASHPEKFVQTKLDTVVIDDQISISTFKYILSYGKHMPKLKTFYVKEIVGDATISQDDIYIPESGVTFYIGDENFKNTQAYETLSNAYFVKGIKMASELDISSYQQKYRSVN